MALFWLSRAGVGGHATGLLETAIAPPLGAWLARRVVRHGRRYYASLLALSAWLGPLLGLATLPETPMTFWGGPLQLRLPAIVWLTAWIFGLAFLATAIRRSGPEGLPVRALGLVAALPMAGLVGVAVWEAIPDRTAMPALFFALPAGFAICVLADFVLRTAHDRRMAARGGT